MFIKPGIRLLLNLPHILKNIIKINLNSVEIKKQESIFIYKKLLLKNQKEVEIIENFNAYFWGFKIINPEIINFNKKNLYLEEE
jgi:hypothetical protein